VLIGSDGHKVTVISLEILSPDPIPHPSFLPIGTLSAADLAGETAAMAMRTCKPAGFDLAIRGNAVGRTLLKRIFIDDHVC